MPSARHPPAPRSCTRRESRPLDEPGVPPAAERVPRAGRSDGMAHDGRTDPRRDGLAERARRARVGGCRCLRHLPRPRWPAGAGRRRAGRRRPRRARRVRRRRRSGVGRDRRDLVDPRARRRSRRCARRARRGTGPTSRPCRSTRRTTRSAPTRARRSASPPSRGDEYDYSRAKAAAEASVRRALGDRAAIVRPGLIVGPGDPTDRFGYWVGAVRARRRATPSSPRRSRDCSAQVIDVDDLAEFIVGAARERLARRRRTRSATSMPLAELLSRSRARSPGTPARRRGR